jgi:alpha-glucosidase
VVYQIYPRSFADSDGDGVGDLEGIRQRIDHLRWLGVDAIWLSPIYRSPMADFGYDVSDHTGIDPTFGDLETFDRLLDDLHEAGIRLILDWVPNHTSDRHPWFVESRSSRESPKRDWYIWRDGPPDTPPNNWPATFGGPAWTYDDATEQWYLHLFLPEQPDLNWANPEVEEAQRDVLRFWLDRGVDGFRADVVHLIGKDPDLPDLPPEYRGWKLPAVHDDPRTHPLLRRIREVVDSYPGERMVVGEVNLIQIELIAPYYGQGDELHLAFNFAPLAMPWEAEEWRDEVERVLAALEPHGGWPTWVLSNHDIVRHRSRLGGSVARARAAAFLLLTLPGTPFLYAGEELGLEDAEVPKGRRQDPAGRDGCRAPIPWDAGEAHGWPSAPWLPFPPTPGRRNVATLREDPTSILHLYRDLLSARRASPALQVGGWRALDAPEQVLAYERISGDDRRLVVVNFRDGEEAEVDLDGGLTVEVASDRIGEGEPFGGLVPPSAAVVLR